MSETLDYLPTFLQGAAVTLGVSVPGFLLGLVFGFFLLICQRSPFKLIYWLSGIYISFVRGTPILVQIFFVYYALPGLLGIDLPPFTAGFLTLSLNSGAFVAEILRGGLADLPKGQWEAANALGMSRYTIWTRVIIPQLFVRTLPPLTNEFTLLLKASPLLSVITVVELTRAAQVVMLQTYLPIEAYLFAGFIYFCMLSLMSYATRRLEVWSERGRA